MDDFGLLVGRFFSTFPTLTDGQPKELLLDSSGRLIIAGHWFGGTDTWSEGDSGVSALAVRQDADGPLTGVADGEYTPLQVDEAGRLRVVVDLDVDMDFVFAEDSAHTTGDLGSFSLSIRGDDITAIPIGLLAGTEGDYQGTFTSARGELWVKDQDANDSLNDIELEIEALTHLEDSPHASGDKGSMALTVRKDVEGSLVDADGDYAPFQVDSDGFLRVTSKLDAGGTEAYAVTDALAAAGDGLEVITSLATPFVTVASFALGVGLNARIYGWQFACDQNCQARIVTDDTVNVIVIKTDVNSSSNPGVREHWSEGGRVEIAGAANLEVKLQIKKRQVAGGDAKGTGSIHARIL